MYTSWITNILCTTVFSCTSAESRIFCVQPCFHVHQLNDEYFMYNRGYMYMSWSTNILCTTAVLCTWVESRIIHVQALFMYMTWCTIVYVQPCFHVHGHNQEWFLYINYVQPCFQGLVQLKYVHKSLKTSAKWPELASTWLNTPHIWPKKSGASRLTFSVHMTKNPDASVHSSYNWNTKVC